MNLKKHIFKYTALFFALILAFGALCACSEEKSELLSYDGVDVSQSVKLCEYKNLTVQKMAGESNAQAIWRVVKEGSEILQYPEEQVNYYLEQSRERCKYYADENDVSYEAAMEALGVTEESMLSDAKALVAEDMIGIALRADANIELTEDEKTRLFDKYAQKYASDFGYSVEYVENELKEQVYDSMRYDKMMEYLIKNNTFAEA